MVEIANDLITHLNGARCAIIKKINGIVAKINERDPSYPRIMMEFHEIVKYRPIVELVTSTMKPTKVTKIRKECEHAKRKNLSKRLLKYFCGSY